jgi:hypothetical protein
VLEIFAKVVSFESLCLRPILGLIFLIEFFPCDSELPTFELSDLDRAHRSAARMSAPNISFKTARSPNAFGMILRRRFGSGN